MRIAAALVIVLALVFSAGSALAGSQELLQLFAMGNLKWKAEPLLKAVQEIAQIKNPGPQMERFHGMCLFKIGYIRFYEGKLSEAQRYLERSLPHFEAALKADPKDIESMFGRAMTYLALVQGGPQLLTRYSPDVNMSIAALEGVDRYHFLTIQSRAARALVFPPELGGDPKLAQTELELLLRFEPENPEVLCWLAVAQARNGQSDKARATLQQVLDKNPDNLRAQVLLKRM